MVKQSSRLSPRNERVVGWALIAVGVGYFILNQALDWPLLAAGPAVFLLGIGGSFLAAPWRRRQAANEPPQRRMDGTYDGASASGRNESTD